MKKVWLWVLVLFFSIASTAGATRYSGSISANDTMYATGGWSDGVPATLSWIVDDESNLNYWTYSYTFTVDEKALSHIIIEVSDSFTEDNIISYSPDFGDGGLSTYDFSNGNPDILDQIYGIKWDTTGDPLSFSFSLVTDKDPVWGDFYAKDGQEAGTGLDVIAYNLAFGTETLAEIGDGNAGGWVLTPDTNGGGGGEVPIPASVFLLGSGLLGLLGFKRKKS